MRTRRSPFSSRPWPTASTAWPPRSMSGSRVGTIPTASGVRNASLITRRENDGAPRVERVASLVCGQRPDRHGRTVKRADTAGGRPYRRIKLRGLIGPGGLERLTFLGESRRHGLHGGSRRRGSHPPFGRRRGNTDTRWRALLNGGRDAHGRPRRRTRDRTVAGPDDGLRGVRFGGRNSQ